MKKGKRTSQNVKVISQQVLSSLFVLIILQFLFACKSTERAVKTDIKWKSTQFLLEQLKRSESNYDWLSAKLSTTAEINNRKFSVTIKLRIRKDSAIWMSVSPALGIEMARVLITKDSLKFINRLNSTYFSGSVNYLNRLIQTDIDLEILQLLLTGNSFSFISDDNKKPGREDKFKSSIDGDRYLLSTLRKRKLRKTIDGKKSLTVPVQRIWLDPESFKVSKLEINDPSLTKDPYGQASKALEVSYSEFKKVDDQVFPYKINFNMNSEQPIRVSLNYSKISINKPQKFPFSIPEKYEQIY